MITTSQFSLISYVLISTFTPGPSNISSASMAVLHGYKNTLKYQWGLAIGVFVLMFLSGWLSTALLSIFPRLEHILRYFGAGYILYLAIGILKASYTFTEKEVKPLGIGHGFLIQILNPKLTVYAFTLFSAFLKPVSANILRLAIIAVGLAGLSFCATSMWALFGTAIKTNLRDSRIQSTVNVVLSFSLIYAALTLIGIL